MMFTEWLGEQTTRPDAVGDLAKHLDGDGWPLDMYTEGDYRAYLFSRNADDWAFNALEEAYMEWQNDW